MVPTKVGKIPPARPRSFGAENRNSIVIPGNPLPSTKTMMKTNTATVSAVAAPRMATAKACVYLGGILISCAPSP